MVLVPHQLFEIEGGGVVEELPRIPQHERLGIDLGRLVLRLLGLHRRFVGLEHVVVSAEDGKPQYDPPILELPNKRGNTFRRFSPKRLLVGPHHEFASQPARSATTPLIREYKNRHLKAQAFYGRRTGRYT